MRLFIVQIILAGLAVLAVAFSQLDEGKPSKAVPIIKRSLLMNSDGTVNLNALLSHIEAVEIKVDRNLNNFESNTGLPHHAAQGSRFRKRGAGVPLKDFDDSEWYGGLSVGTPAENFTVVFDTGSSDTFVASSYCQNCTGHKLWDPKSSSTAKDRAQPFTVRYGGGEFVDGEQFIDVVSLAGFTATNQTLGAATAFSSGFNGSKYPADGLVGLGFQSLSTFNASPVFETLVSDGQVHDSVFSFKLSTDGAELYVGGVNSALYTGEFAYSAVTVEGWWETNITELTVNGKTIRKEIDCIIDTGTTFVVGPSSEVADMYKALGGKPAPADISGGYYTFPCNSFPNISLTFGDHAFPISALNLGKLPDDPSECVSGLVGGDFGASFWIIGDVFLRGVYTKFDVGQMRIGFAELS